MAQHTLYPSNSDYVCAVKALISKYPYLRDAEGNGYEMGRMHAVNLSRCFQDSFSKIVSNVLSLAKGKSVIEAHYMDARREAVAESLCGRTSHTISHCTDFGSV